VLIILLCTIDFNLKTDYCQFKSKKMLDKENVFQTTAFSIYMNIMVFKKY